MEEGTKKGREEEETNVKEKFRGRKERKKGRIRRKGRKKKKE